MEFDEDDIYDVLLVNLRLATWLGLKQEQQILADGLLDGGVPIEVIDVWQQPLLGGLQNAVGDTLKNLAEYQPVILTFPDIFAGGMIGRCCDTIALHAMQITATPGVSNLRLCSA